MMYLYKVVDFKLLPFFITTHSPLLLNAMSKEQIHILNIDQEGKRSIRHP